MKFSEAWRDMDNDSFYCPYVPIRCGDVPSYTQLSGQNTGDNYMSFASTLKNSSGKSPKKTTKSVVKKIIKNNFDHFAENYINQLNDVKKEKQQKKKSSVENQNLSTSSEVEYEPLKIFEFSSANDKAVLAVSEFPSYLPDKNAVQKTQWRPETTKSELPKSKDFNESGPTQSVTLESRMSLPTTHPVMEVTIVDSPFDFDIMSDQPTPTIAGNRRFTK